MLDIVKKTITDNKDELGILSSFIAGSCANSSQDLLSDVDIIIIGSEKNQYENISRLKTVIYNIFTKGLNRQTIFYCDPIQELLCLLNNENVEKLRVHVIYHPLSRFLQYIENNDQVLLGWKSNYKLLCGNDYLDTDKLSMNKINHLEYFDLIINNIIQLIQNSYLTTSVKESYFYNLKLYKYIIKRLEDFDQRGTFKHFKIEKPLNYFDEIDDIRKFIVNINKTSLKNKITNCEKILLKLYADFNFIKKG